MKDYFQGVLKVWNAFTNVIKQIAIKHRDENLQINTFYFGKFYMMPAEKVSDDNS